jgi:cobalt/nickel transport system ATP-binding protein
MIFEARELSYRYNEQLALNGLSLEVKQGQRLALLGANGSGKSTLLRLLDGLAFPHTGELLFDGEPLTEAKLAGSEFTFKFRRRVGLVFQNPDTQLFNPTVFDEIAFGPLQLGWPKEQIRDRVNHTLDTMEIAHLKHRSPHRLSGGEKKRVAIASVMILDPEVLLLDEPTAALDPKSQRQIIDLIASFSGGSKTVITATHDLDSLEEISDRCVLFESGRIVGDGSAMEVLHNIDLLRSARLVATHRHSHGPGEPHPHVHLHEGHLPSFSEPSDSGTR